VRARVGWLGVIVLAFGIVLIAATAGRIVLGQGGGEVTTEFPPGSYIGPEGELLDGATGVGTPGDDQAAITTAGFQKNIAASNFPPRESATTRDYGGAGCSYRTSSSGYFTANLDLPDGVVITGVRAYFYDTSTVDGAVYLYSFNGLGSYELHSATYTAGNSGSGHADGPPLNVLVDNANESLALILDFGTGSDDSLRFCNIVVSYRGENNLPVVTD
jgi:hypothetical protein